MIFFDLDGVLANFHKGGCQLLGIPEDESFIKRPDFWNKVDEDFWINLELMPDAQQLVDLALGYTSPENIGILTSPARNPRNLSGKAFWVQKHFPDLYENLLVGRQKHFCAKPGNILIDDWEINIDLFDLHGGKGILVPRPWNEMRGCSDPVKHVAIELSRHFVGVKS